MNRLSSLFQKYYDKTATHPEREELMQILSGTSAEVLEELVQQTGVNLHEVDHILSSMQEERILKNILPNYDNEKSVSVHRVHFIRREWFHYAAVVIVALSVSIYLWLNSSREQIIPSVNKHMTADIAPGKNGALLILDNGTQVVLDSLANGLIASQNGAKVILKNGQLTYYSTGDPPGEIVYNKISTPRGRQFQVTLPDGTQVWLNAGSSIRYPTVFNGKERRVEITGEAYFEVAKNATMPFRVNVNNKAEIEVLGTHFNVNGYENEKSLNTTLLEGSIKVNGTMIMPGQQAQLSNAIHIVNNADVDKITAWKNGLFDFDGATLEEIMKQLERWYDIDVVYEKGIPDIKFEGKMTKGVTLTGLLIALERSDVHFRIQGRKLIVLP